MGGGIGYCLGGLFGPLVSAGQGSGVRLDAALEGIFVACPLDKARVGGVEAAALDGVTHLIIKGGDLRGNLAHVALYGGGFRTGRSFCRPGLAVDQDLGINLVKSRPDGVHGVNIVDAHQVKTEAVKMILRCPVGEGVDHVFLVHRTVGGSFVAAAGTVGIGSLRVLAVVVARNGEVEPVVLAGAAVVRVVVHNVHDDADTLVVKCLHHLLEFLDAHAAVIRIGGVGAFRGVVVHGIIAPVEQVGVGAGLVYTGIIVDGQEVNVGDAQILQVVDACGVDTVTVDGGACFGKRKELTLVFHAGIRSGGEVLDVYLPDHGIGLVLAFHPFVVFPAGGIGAVKVHDHASHAVDAGGPGVDIYGLLGGAACRDKVGVVGVGKVSGDGDGPDTVAAFCHILGFNDAGAGFGITAGLVALDLDRRSGGCPDLEGGG